MKTLIIMLIGTGFIVGVASLFLSLIGIQFRDFTDFMFIPSIIGFVGLVVLLKRKQYQSELPL